MAFTTDLKLTRTADNGLVLLNMNTASRNRRRVLTSDPVGCMDLSMQQATDIYYGVCPTGFAVVFKRGVGPYSRLRKIPGERSLIAGDSSYVNEGDFFRLFANCMTVELSED